MTGHGPQQPGDPQQPGGQGYPQGGGYPPPQGPPPPGYPPPQGPPQQGYPPPQGPGYPPPQGPPPGGPPPGWGGNYGPPPGQPKRNPWPWVALGVIAIAGLVIGLVFGLQGDDEDSSNANATAPPTAGSDPSGGGGLGGGGACDALVGQLNSQLGIDASVTGEDAEIPDGAPTPDGDPATVCEVSLDSFGGQDLSSASVVLAEFEGADADEFGDALEDEGWRGAGSGGMSAGGATAEIYFQSGSSNVITVISGGGSLFVAYVSGVDGPNLPVPMPTVSVPMPGVPGD